MLQQSKKRKQSLKAQFATLQRAQRKLFIDEAWKPTDRAFSLSRYYPEDTTYFYAYPSGEASQFYNNVPPHVEELVAARPLSQLGPNVNAVVFHNSLRPQTRALLEEAGTTLASAQRITSLPQTIDRTMVGAARNHAVKRALLHTVQPGTLVMAQPFLDPAVRHLYQIAPSLTVWLNDKKNMFSYIPHEFLPEQYARFESGRVFAASRATYPFPCVVKLTSSSSGDGVHICKNEEDFAAAKKDFRGRHMTITVDQYIPAVKNFGIQFGIPHDPRLPIDVIGVDEQLTDEDGVFLGGSVDPTRHDPIVDRIAEVLRTTILPHIRSLGWYGPGGFDVLVDARGRFYFVDANFRMTGMSNFIFAAANKTVTQPLISFYGSFTGSLAAFREAVLAHTGSNARPPILQLVSLTHIGHTWHFQGALFARQQGRLASASRTLLAKGVHSAALEAMASA